MKQHSEAARWVADYIAGAGIKEIAKRYMVPIWRVANAINWDATVAEFVVTVKYPHHVAQVREILTRTPAISADCESIPIHPTIFRAIRYALIIREGFPNYTRYKRVVTPQEEARIQQIAELNQQHNHLRKLAKTTGRTYQQQLNISNRILGKRIIQYRRDYGTCAREIEARYGIAQPRICHLLKLGVFQYPFTDDTLEDLLKRGFALYESANSITKPYQDITAHYRTIQRSRYASSTHISAATITARAVVSHNMKVNNIPFLALHPDGRYRGYDRAAVTRYYERLGRRVVMELREYGNDWLHLRCSWYTW